MYDDIAQPYIYIYITGSFHDTRESFQCQRKFYGKR